MNKIVITIILIIIVLILAYWTINNINTEKEEPKRHEVSNAIINPDLSLPTNLKFQVEEDTIYVFWNDVEGVDSYKIYFSIYEDFTREDARSIEKIETGEFQINKVPNGTYYFRLVSVKNGKESEWSELGSVVINHYEVPDPPTDVQVKRISDGIRISWQSDISAQLYKIMMRSVGNNKVIDKIYSVNSTETFFIVPNEDIIDGRDYYASVSVVTGPNSQSYFSDEIFIEM